MEAVRIEREVDPLARTYRGAFGDLGGKECAPVGVDERCSLPVVTRDVAAYVVETINSE